MKGAIFDLDGTLLDSMGVWRQIDVDFLARRGLQVPEDYMEAISHLSFKEAADYTIRRFGFKETPEEIIDEWMEMAKEAYAHRIMAKKGAHAYLEKLKLEGVHIGAATSCDPALFLPCLKNRGLLEYFETIVTAKEVKRGKGFPDIYERAAEQMGVSPAECMVYEDIYQGVKGARMGGFSVIGILDPASDYEWDKIRELADQTIISFEELL